MSCVLTNLSIKENPQDHISELEYSLFPLSCTIYAYQLLHSSVNKEAEGLTWISLSLCTSAVLLFLPCCFLLKDAKKTTLKPFVFSFANPALLPVPEQTLCHGLGTQNSFHSFQGRFEHLALKETRSATEPNNLRSSAELTEIDLKLLLWIASPPDFISDLIYWYYYYFIYRFYL